MAMTYGPNTAVLVVVEPADFKTEERASRQECNQELSGGFLWNAWVEPQNQTVISEWRAVHTKNNNYNQNLNNNNVSNYTDEQ